jgi:hypothetical protein
MAIKASVEAWRDIPHTEKVEKYGSKPKVEKIVCLGNYFTFKKDFVHNSKEKLGDQFNMEKVAKQCLRKWKSMDLDAKNKFCSVKKKQRRSNKSKI